MDTLDPAVLLTNARALLKTVADVKTQVIHLHRHAPAKPAPAQACNGCGVCCAFQPCPLGMLLSRRASGACLALEWHAQGKHYRCGALARPAQWLPWVPQKWAERWARRWISAGSGCDSDLQTQPPTAGWLG